MAPVSAVASADPERRFGGLKRLYGVDPAQREALLRGRGWHQPSAC